MELDDTYNKSLLKRAIIWSGALDDCPDWKVKDNIYVPISTVIDNEEPEPEVEESEICIHINPDIRVKAGSGEITIDYSSKITTNTFLLYFNNVGQSEGITNNAPEETAEVNAFNANIFAKYLNTDEGKSMKPFTIKAFYRDEGVPHYWRVVYKAGRYFLITGIRTSSSNNERVTSQYMISHYKLESGSSDSYAEVFYLQLTDGYNVIS